MNGGGAGITLRIAGADDADAIAAVFSRSYRTLRFLPELHTVAEDRWFIANVILKECVVAVAESHGRIAGFLARQDTMVRLLFVDPDGIGQGAGSLLLDAAKTCGLPALELWCFQANTRARRFYEARGFRAVEFTDGARNEEQLPDVRYRWERPSETDGTGAPPAFPTPRTEVAS